MDFNAMRRTFAEAFGRAAIEKIHASEKGLVNFVIPIYCESADVRLSHIGSAVLLQVAKSKLLLTAAHVVDHRSEGTLCMPGDGELIAVNGDSYCTRLPRGGVRDDDNVDVGLCRLTEETAASVVSYSFLNLNDLSAGEMPDFGRLFTFIGYPNSRNDVRYRVRPSPYSFLNVPLPPAMYTKYQLLSFQ